ncbi:hypothetical protein HRR99_05845 [Agrobacterium vaccinii]|uniref:hypothetical protein n=1 Tax=Agrobacterium vaccinii TaxID=2735528 RepID=UPI001E305483|nr:hypothetical protein [Agrobacterium vaccinii]UHS61070.1 hypothetical protein HRR99_05845 [Agrobacterium vaccinii]
MNDALNKLPIFASDKEIALAIVGRTVADEWIKHILPKLEARGFPLIDSLHGRRPVPLVKKYYDQYLGVSTSYIQSGPTPEEDKTLWTTSRRSRRLKSKA